MKLKSLFFLFLYSICVACVNQTALVEHGTTQDTVKTPSVSDTVAITSIAQLTQESVVIAYLKQHKTLPVYYITKSEARRLGWVPTKGNLCIVAPGKAIGGDIFTNRQKKLPSQKKRQYFEADINYHCGYRNADRIVFSNDGLIFVTHDHYETFVEK